MGAIYLVEGATGEYGDINIWIVKAFAKKLKANELAKKLNKHAKEYYKKAAPLRDNDNGDSIDWTMLANYENPLDKRASMDYTGTNYEVKKVDFER